MARGENLFVCPQCGSFEVFPDAIPQLGQLYKCRECGYQGAMVIEADSVEDAVRIQAEIKADDTV